MKSYAFTAYFIIEQIFLKIKKKKKYFIKNDRIPTNKKTYPLIIYFIYLVVIIHCNPAATKEEHESSKRINITYNAIETIYDYKNKNTWYVLPIRSKEEYDLGMTGGEAEQHPYGITRCISRPEFIYFSHDVCGAWRSRDAGSTWQKTLDKGLFANNGQSIEVDPVNPNILLLEADNAWNWLAKDYKGVYRSIDSGDTWKLVLRTQTNYDHGIHSIYRHNIAYDPVSINKNSALRWYAAFPDNGIYRSEDGGISWSTLPLSPLKGHSIVYCVQAHSSDGKSVYVGTNKGFFISFSRGTNLIKSGNLPDGSVSSIAINQKNPQIIYITIKAKGLYRSLDCGKNFSELKKFDAARVFINPGFPNVMYLVGLESSTITTNDSGISWRDEAKTIPAPGLGRDSKWKSKISGELTGIVPNPKDPNEAVAFSRATIWKTIDGGKLFKDSSTLFTGFAWGWSNSGAAFNIHDKNRFAFFNFDVGMKITNNSGKYFDQRNKTTWKWYKKGILTWIGTYSGAIQPIKNSKVIVASVGGYWRTQLMRSKNEGKTWDLIDNLEENGNFFIAFNCNNPDIIYAGNKISYDAGITFQNINFEEYNELKPSLFGMCNAHPNTVYAIDSNREYILRSDDACKKWYMYAHPGWKIARLDPRPTFTADPQNPDKIYTLDKFGDLTIFNGKSWKNAGVLGLAHGEKIGNFVRSIVVDPNRPEIIYAGMNARGISCVWRSTDDGKSWQDITYNLPRTGISTMAVNPHTGELFVGSVHGTWIFPTPY